MLAMETGAYAFARTVAAISRSGAVSPTMNPSDIRFSQNSIGARFKNGQSIQDVAEGLSDETISPKSFPPIRLVDINGTPFTLDNRRLAAFQIAGVPVPYTWASQREELDEFWKFTTPNVGQSVQIRGGPNVGTYTLTDAPVSDQPLTTGD
jgi:hypothetical protein